jgi:hypothetical protein
MDHADVYGGACLVDAGQALREVAAGLILRPQLA